MRTRHPPGCACDQSWHHRPSPLAAQVARRGERERMNASRAFGKILGNLARERRREYDDTPGAPP